MCLLLTDNDRFMVFFWELLKRMHPSKGTWRVCFDSIRTQAKGLTSEVYSKDFTGSRGFALCDEVLLLSLIVIHPNTHRHFTHTRATDIRLRLEKSLSKACTSFKYLSPFAHCTSLRIPFPGLQPTTPPPPQISLKSQSITLSIYLITHTPTHHDIVVVDDDDETSLITLFSFFNRIGWLAHKGRKGGRSAGESEGFF